MFSFLWFSVLKFLFIKYCFIVLITLYKKFICKYFYEALWFEFTLMVNTKNNNNNKTWPQNFRVNRQILNKPVRVGHIYSFQSLYSIWSWALCCTLNRLVFFLLLLMLFFVFLLSFFGLLYLNRLSLFLSA